MTGNMAEKHLARLQRKLAEYYPEPPLTPSEQDFADLYHVIFRTHRLNKGKQARLIALGWMDKHGKLTSAGKAQREEAMETMKRRSRNKMAGPISLE